MGLRLIIPVLVLSILIGAPVLADEDFDMFTKVTSDRPGERYDYAWGFRYHPNGENNDLYVQGGLCDGTYIDDDGQVWRLKLHGANPVWSQLRPFAGTTIPPLRHGHSGGICVTDSPVANIDDTTSTVHNFVTFGGYDDSNDEYLNDTWVFAEIKLKNQKRKRSTIWKWVEADNIPAGSFIPVKRKHAVMVPYPGPNGENSFFLLGGVDSTERKQNVFTGILNRMTPTPDPQVTVTPTNQGASNPGVEFDMIWSKKANPPADVGLEGAAAVYDPYYGDYPRMLVYGGINANGGLSPDVFEYKLEGTPGWATFTPLPAATPTPTTGPGTPSNTAIPTVPTPNPRCFHAMALDIREHRLLVHGGSNDDSDPDYLTAMDDLWEYDLLTQTWKPLTTTNQINRWKHSGVFNWFTLFGGQDDNGDCHDHIMEYFPAVSGKTWDVMVNADYGLDNPNTVINTQRVKPNDIVRIHQTASTWPGDVFDVKLYIPWYISNLTIEGVNNGDIRAGLWSTYEPTPISAIIATPTPLTNHPMLKNPHSEEGREALREGFSMSQSTVIQDSAGSTFRNLIIGHHLPNATPIADLHTDILEHYERIANHTNKIFSMQMLDVGMVATAPSRVENCEFLANGVGYVMICVSSTYEPNWVHDTIFKNNMIGALELETRHRVYNNIFTGNKLCGIEFDKGAHGMAYDNLFIDNGGGDVPDSWRCGIISGYSICGGVPAMQQPLIYNNTFINNPAALSIWEDGDIRQFVNSPCFFNNIMYTTDATADAAIYHVNNDRNRVISFHNCMDGYSDFFEYNGMNLLSSRDFEDDPLFVDSDEYRLDSEPLVSPCIDTGFHSLSPGATDMNEIMDGYFLDIGYHFTDIEPVMGPPEDLEFDETANTLSWSVPSGESPAGYVVYWEDVDGILIGVQWVTGTISNSLANYLNQGYWFGVCAHENGQFGETAFIEL